MQINAGAIIPSDTVPGLYCVEAITASGNRRFEGREIEAREAQAPQVERARVKQYIKAFQVHIIDRPRTRPTRQASVLLHSWIPSPDRHEPVVREVEESEFAAETILQRFEMIGSDVAGRRDLVIEAETVDFAGALAQSLIDHLRRFVEEARVSDAPHDAVALGSAIRKLIAIASLDEAMDFAAGLLAPDSRRPLSLPMEVELTKMIVRKLSANPIDSADSIPKLARCLADLARIYLNPRLLAREKYGAIALNAVLGLVLTRHNGSGSIVEHLRSLDAAWFQQLVGTRAVRLREELGRRTDAARLAPLLGDLDQLGALAATPS